MFSALSALGSIASLFKFLFNWLRENQIFNAGRKEQQRVELQETFNRLKQANEIRNTPHTVDDDLNELRSDTPSSDK